MYLSQNQEPKAFKELQIAVKQNPFNIIAKYYYAGLLAYHKDPIQAIRIYEQIEIRHPYFLLINYQKSLIYKELKLYRLAYEEILKAERLYPLDEVIQAEKKNYIIKRGE